MILNGQLKLKIIKKNNKLNLIIMFQLFNLIPNKYLLIFINESLLK